MTDVTGFTALGEAADPEWLYNLINDVFAELVDCLAAYGAHIDKYMGDEVMALFGVPMAQEGSIERAVRAALAMHQRVHELNRQGRFGQVQLGLHTGINVGPVMVGPVGHRAHADYTVIGDAVNVTKRLEDAAPENGIYVSRAVRDAVADLFEFEPAGRLALSGRRHEVEVFRVVAAADAKASDDGAVAGPLLGREAELAVLSAAAATGEGTAAVYVVGPAGIGKSRLIREWSHGVPADRRLIAHMACRAFGQHFPRLPLLEIVTQALGLPLRGWPPRVAGSARLALKPLGLSAAACEALVRLSETFEGGDADPPAEWRETLAGALRELLGRLTEAGPACLVLEDIQWLDEASREVLADLFEAPCSWPLLVVVSSREPLDERFPACLQARTLSLPGLPAGVMRQLVAVWAAPDVLPDSTIGAICDRADGHPYFARELVGALRRPSGGAATGRADLPHTLQELFLAQLDWLPLGLRRLVQAASVLGEPLSPTLLRAAMGDETALTESLLAEAQQAGLLAAAGSADQFVFSRRLLFEAAYTTIPPTQRRDVHTRIADHIIGELPGLGEPAIHPAAHHAYLGYGDERAIGLLLRSARRYRLEYANRQAIRDAGRATEVIGSLLEPSAYTEQRLEALWLLAQSYEVLGDLGRAEGALLEAGVLAEDSRNPEMVAQIALATATLRLMQGECEEAERQFERAAQACEALGDATRVAHAWLGVGMCANSQGDLARALTFFTRAASSDAALWVRAAALNNAGTVLMQQGLYREAQRYLDEGLAANEAEGDRRGTAHSKASLGELCYRLARLPEASRWLLAALAEGDEIEDAYCSTLARVLLARAAVLRGEVEEARGLVAEAASEAPDADLEALRQLAEADVEAASGPAAARVLSELAPPVGASAVRLNSSVEGHCLVIDALRSREARSLPDLCRVLSDALAYTPDRHLRRYGEWLAELASQPGERPVPLALSPDGEWTVFDERAKGLQEALMGP